MSVMNIEDKNTMQDTFRKYLTIVPVPPLPARRLGVRLVVFGTKFET